MAINAIQQRIRHNAESVMVNNDIPELDHSKTTRRFVEPFTAEMSAGDLDKRQRRAWKANRYCRLCGKPKIGDPVKDQR